MLKVLIVRKRSIYLSESRFQYYIECSLPLSFVQILSKYYEYFHTYILDIIMWNIWYSGVHNIFFSCVDYTIWRTIILFIYLIKFWYLLKHYCLINGWCFILGWCLVLEWCSHKVVDVWYKWLIFDQGLMFNGGLMFLLYVDIL